MDSILLVIHVVLGLVIIGLIMIQQGKGADMGASFGAGSSQTVFGAAGSGNFFSRTTGILVTGFFATSIILAWMSKERVDDFEPDIPVMEDVRAAPPVDEAVPAAPPVDEMAPAAVGTTPESQVDPVPVSPSEPAPVSSSEPVPGGTAEEVPID